MHCPICGEPCKQRFINDRELDEKSATIWQCPAGHGSILNNCRLTRYTDGRAAGYLQMFRSAKDARRSVLKQEDDNGKG